MFVVDMGESDEGLVFSEEAMVEGCGWWDRLIRRRRMKKSVKKWRKFGDFDEQGSEIGDDDDDLGSAMQIERKDHPPRSHKGSISINQLQG